MNFLQKNEKRIRTLFVLGFLLLVFCIVAYWALAQPWGVAPDENERHLIAAYIVKHHKLPNGGDSEIMLDGWGFSYGFQPILPYIVSAMFEIFLHNFTENEVFNDWIARFPNVIYGVILAFIVYRLSKKLFKETSVQVLFTVLVSFLPQAMYMHTFVNVDSMALLSTGIIVFAWIDGIQTHWKKKSVILLGIGCGLCAMSYYDAYAFILCSIFVFIESFVHFRPKDETGEKKGIRVQIEWKEMLLKGIAIFAIAFAIGGWWFIRSYYLYDGDFLGMKTRLAYAEKYAAKMLKPSNEPTWMHEGFSLWDMLRMSDYLIYLRMSFVGYFEHMRLVIFSYLYPIYYTIFVVGIGGALIFAWRKNDFTYDFEKKTRVWLYLNFTACILITNWLCLWASYSMDYQPQGRYIMPMLIPFMYFVTLGWRKVLGFIPNKKVRDVIMYAMAILYIAMMLHIFKDIIFTKYHSNFMEALKWNLTQL